MAEPIRDEAGINRLGSLVMQVIGPALAIVVVYSIAGFSIEICYSGPFVARVKWIFALFSFAAVLISRISIEEGLERASLFGILLGIATFFVAARFLQGNPLFLIGIISFVWWSAGRLTWDCTFIDSSRDVTGQGMIDLAIDRVNSSGSDSTREAELPPLPLDPDLVHGDETALVDRQRPWQKFVDFFWKRKQDNSPGLWAFYFLLGGLPLFGIGQLFMGMTDGVGHRAAAWHFMTYIVGLLGLLMFSSIIGLHRYLKENQSSMPDSVARRWIVVGTLLALSISIFCFLLPRPTARYSIGTWLPRLTTPSSEASDISAGGDGQKKNKDNRNVDTGPGARDGRSENTDSDKGEQGGGNSRKSNDGAATNTAGGEQSGGQKKDGKQGSGGDKKSGDNSQAKSNRRDQEQGSPDSKSGKEPRSGEPSSKPNDSPEQRDDEQGRFKSKGNQKRAGKKQNQEKRSSSGQFRQPSRSADRQSQGSSASSDQSTSSSTTASNFLTRLVKLVFWIIMLLVTGWFVIKHHSKIGFWLSSFLAEMLDFWNRLWNRKPGENVADSATTLVASPPAADLPPFTRFENPFKSEDGRSWPVERLVTYTFQAFEAWSRDHACPREPEQTAIEFANATVARFKTLENEAAQLAHLYSTLAYAGQASLSRKSVMGLSSLWDKLTMMYAAA